MHSHVIHDPHDHTCHLAGHQRNMGLAGMGRPDHRAGKEQKENAVRRYLVEHKDSQAWLRDEGGGQATQCELLSVAASRVSHGGGGCSKGLEGAFGEHTTSSFTLLMRRKLARYSSSSRRKFFRRSKAFSCFVCTGSCLASFP